MREKMNEKVSVVSLFSAQKQRFMPYQMRWKGRDYKITELGMTHKYKVGDTWHHIFEVTDTSQGLSFRLRLNTKELSWTLEVVSDGLPA